MDVIFISKNGLIDDPILIKYPTTAEAVFDGIVEEYLIESEVEELKYIFDYGDKYERVNQLLRGSGIEIFWFTGLKVNKYKNND